MHCDDKVLRALESYDKCIENAKSAPPNIFCAHSGCARSVVGGSPYAYFPACSSEHLEIAGLPSKSGSLMATLGAMGEAHLRQST
jgi:hypothetical protein